MNQIEALESRTLMSASLASNALSSAVIADRAQIRVDLLKFRSDVFSCFGRTLRDVAAIRAAHPKNATTVLPLIGRMRKDISQIRFALAGDHLADRSNVLADESLIVGKRRRILLDQGKPSAETADKQSLLAVRIKLQQDMITGLDRRIAARQLDYNTIFNDEQMVITAVQSGPNGTARLQSDETNLVNDRTTCMNNLMPDLQMIASDREQLITDLTALQST